MESLVHESLEGARPVKPRGIVTLSGEATRQSFCTLIFLTENASWACLIGLRVTRPDGLFAHYLTSLGTTNGQAKPINAGWKKRSQTGSADSSSRS